MSKITRQEVASLLPKRSQTAHKGNFGRVLVVAGSRSMCGAGYLCSKAALRSGAGLVFWALPKSMQPAFAAALPEAITVPLPEDEEGLLSGARLRSERYPWCQSPEKTSAGQTDSKQHTGTRPALGRPGSR